MSTDALKQLQLTLLNKGAYKLSTFRSFIRSKSEKENCSSLSFQLDFAVDCQEYQKFCKKYYTQGMPVNQSTNDIAGGGVIMKTSEMLKNSALIPFMKRPAKITLEKYNADLEKIKTMLNSIQDYYLTPTSPKLIPLESSILDPLVKLLDKGYAHPDIFSEAYLTVSNTMLPYFQDFIGSKKPRRSSLLTFFTEKSLEVEEHFTSMFTLSDTLKAAPRRSSMVSSSSSSLSKKSSDDVFEYQDIPRTQSRKNSRFDASLPILIEMSRLDEVHSISPVD